MAKQSGLTTRQFERAEVDLDVEFAIASEHHAQVHFSANSSAPGADVVRGRATDISPGGIGVRSPLFVPRMCEGTIRVFGPSANGGGVESRRVIFEHAAKIRRVYMDNADKQYALGVAFIQPNDSQHSGSSTEQRVHDLLRCIGLDLQESNHTDA